MKFFVDTANLDQIREANELGVLDGVTTNPSLMAKEGIRGQENINKHYVDICHIVDGDVSAEVIATDYKGMIAEGEALAALHPHIVVKVPCIAEGIKAVKYFSTKGIRTNCTLVFSPGHAFRRSFGRYLQRWCRIGIENRGYVCLLRVSDTSVSCINSFHSTYHTMHRCRCRCGYLSAQCH